MRYAVVTSIKDEGPFIVEWVCWHRMLGFDDIIVLTNDCTDHSAPLLAALQAAGWVRHLDITIPKNTQPTPHKLAQAMQMPQVSTADWIMLVDIDEFLVIHRGNGRIRDLIPPGEDSFLGMALNWNIFGTSFRQKWADGLTHRQLTRCAWKSSLHRRWFKSIFRRPELFARLRPHGPWPVDMSQLDGPWGSGANRWVNSAYETIPDWDPSGEYPQKTKFPSFEGAQMNHYILRSRESFELKRGTASGNSDADRYTDEYFQRYNINQREDSAVYRYRADFDRIHAAAMALPGVHLNHHLCCSDYLERIAAKTGTRATEDPRWHAHMAAVDATPG